MKVFYEVEVIAVVPVSFTSGIGETVEYNEVHLLNVNEDGGASVLKFNSKSPDFSVSLKGKSGVAEIDVDITGKNKPKLLGIKVSQ